MATEKKLNEIYITRTYDAPLKKIWDAWTDPQQVSQWWGPRGYTITTNSMDVKTGGTWSYVMHGPDGTDYQNKTKYLEVQKYVRMVYDHGGNDDRPPLFRVTVNFSETNGKTTMAMSMALPTAESANEIKKHIKNVGGDATWDRLAEHLSSTDKFFINRSFDAPLPVMFQMWTDPNHISQWAPPTGFTMKYIYVTIKPGGTAFYSMSGAGGMKMHGKVKYIEMTEPNRLVYTQQFCDEKENRARHPLAPTWPETMLTTVTLTEEGPTTTRVTIEWEIYGEASAVERETFNKGKPGMTQGWSGSFEKLEQHLKTAKKQ